jgi:hypothetical protein
MCGHHENLFSGTKPDSTATARSAIDIGAWHSSTMRLGSKRKGADNAAGAACNRVSIRSP